MLQYFRSDAVVVRFPAAGLCDPLSPEERNRPQETRHDQDEQLPVKQQVVTVEEGHSRHDGLWRKRTESKRRVRNPDMQEAVFP